MAALIEHLARWLAGDGFVERKEEHAALGAEALLLARRMPSCGESFWREHNPFAARMERFTIWQNLLPLRNAGGKLWYNSR